MFLHPLLPFLDVIIIKKIKILIALTFTVILIFTSCLCVSAVSPIDSRRINEMSVQVTGFDGTLIRTIKYNPVVLDSPNGGSFYGVNLEQNLVVSPTDGYSANCYFDNFVVTPGKVYTIKFNVVLPYQRAVSLISSDSPHYSLNFDWFHAFVLDSNGFIRLNRESYEADYWWFDSLSPPESTSNGMYVANSYNVNGAKFFFIPYEFTFSCTSEYVLNKINFGFNFKQDRNVPSAGYFGISDFSIDEVVDSAVMLNAFDDIEKNLNSIKNSLLNLPLSIRNTANDMLSSQRIFANDIISALNELRDNNINGFNDVVSAIEDGNKKVDESLNSDIYSKPDDSKLQEEDALTESIYSETADNRDTAVDVITGIVPSGDGSDDPGGGSTTNFLDSMFIWVDVFDELTSTIPWFNGILDFSLALGIFGFLFGLVSIAIGSFGDSKKSSSDKQKQNRRVSKNMKNRGG